MNLIKISFSTPALHTIDRFTYPIEVHLYHRNPDTSEILVQVLDVNDVASKSSGVFRFIWKQYAVKKRRAEKY